eukprot:scaffold14682_cov124-Isochrysis_galbana.AAC.8
MLEALTISPNQPKKTRLPFRCPHSRHPHRRPASCCTAPPGSTHSEQHRRRRSRSRAAPAREAPCSRARARRRQRSRLRAPPALRAANRALAWSRERRTRARP